MYKISLPLAFDVSPSLKHWMVFSSAFWIQTTPSECTFCRYRNNWRQQCAVSDSSKFEPCDLPLPPLVRTWRHIYMGKVFWHFLQLFFSNSLMFCFFYILWGKLLNVTLWHTCSYHQNHKDFKITLIFFLVYIK